MSDEVLTVRVAFDAPSILAVLERRRRGPLLPAFTGATLQVVLGPATREAVARALAAAEPETAAFTLRRLEGQSQTVAPGTAPEMFADPARDEPLRAAVAAGAAYLVTADAEIAERRGWKDITLVGSWDELEREFLAQEETVVLYRAATGAEAAAVQEALEEEGIDSFARSGEVPWLDGVLIVGQGFWGDIYVFKKDFERAREIVARIPSE